MIIDFGSHVFTSLIRDKQIILCLPHHCEEPSVFPVSTIRGWCLSNLNRLWQKTQNTLTSGTSHIKLITCLSVISWSPTWMGINIFDAVNIFSKCGWLAAHKAMNDQGPGCWCPALQRRPHRHRNWQPYILCFKASKDILTFVSSPLNNKKLTLKRCGLSQAGCP